MEEERKIKSKSLDIFEDQIKEVSKIATKMEAKRDKTIRGKKIKDAAVWRLVIDKGIDSLKTGK